MDVAIEYGKKKGGSIESQVEHALDRLLVEFGKEILKIIPGKVSTEVDARYSFDIKASVGKAIHIIKVRGQKRLRRDGLGRKQQLTALHSSTRSRASPRTAS